MSQNPLVTVLIGEVWKHKRNHNYYVITNILNKDNPLDDDNNPPIIVYREFGRAGERPLYGRLFTRWHQSFDAVEGK